jgi:26 proteasome complex subunit DSS1
MSAAPPSKDAPKAAAADKTADSVKDPKPAAALEEDDEFEDFPVESTLPFYLRIRHCSTDTYTFWRSNADDIVLADWTQEDTEVPGDNTHLWEESWDDDDTSEDFSAQLK